MTGMIEGYRVMEDRGDAWHPVASSWDIGEALLLFKVAVNTRACASLILVDPRDNTLSESNVRKLTDTAPHIPHNDK